METRLGIVFTGGEGPEPETIRRIFEALSKDIATQTLTVAADSGLMPAEAAGLRPDWIVGDMDSVDSEERLNRYDSERVIRYNTDKDYTDTELAFNLLRENGCGEIWIIGGGGGRIDHLFGIREMFERKDPPGRWITASEDIYCIEGAGDAGGAVIHNGLETCLETGSLVSVFPLGEGPWKAESRGLKWPLDNVHWERGLYSLSNVAVEKEITINAVQGRFLVVFPSLQ